MKQQRESGFSLLELLVAVAIVLILIAALAPALLSSIEAANESTAAQNLRAFAKAEGDYEGLYPNNFAQSATYLGGAIAAGKCPAQPDPAGQYSCLLPDEIAQAVANRTTVTGYDYTYTAPTQAGGVWALTAVPHSSLSGRKSYCIDSTTGLRYVLGTTAPTVTSGSCTSGTLIGF